MTMENNNRNWFSDLRSQPGQPPLSQQGSLVIDKVALGSPADELGLKEGDLILKINDKPADEVDVLRLAIDGLPINYHLYQASSETLIWADTLGLLLGCRYSKSTDALVRDIKAYADDYIFACMTLWQRADYDRLREACQPNGVVGKILRLVYKNPVYDLMLAVCDIEQGLRENQSSKVLNVFEREHNSDYTSDINGLVYYYRAKEATKQQDLAQAEDYAEYIGRFSPSYARLVEFVKSINADYLADESPNLDKQFNANNDLVHLDAERTTFTLSEILEKLPENTLLPICLMSSYRANGPYHDCIECYHAMQPYVKHKLSPLLVITDQIEASEHQQYWLRSENAAKKAEVPLNIVYDEQTRFAWDVELNTAPKFIVINKERQIVSDEMLSDEFSYWSMMSLD